MTRAECPRESEVIEAALGRRVGCETSEELAAHVGACATCAEVAAMAAVFAACRDDTVRDARVPAAGLVWWRSALRAHAEATRAARGPLLWPLGIAGACAFGLAGAVLQVTWPQLYETVQALGAAASTLQPDAAELIRAVRPALPFVTVALGFVLLAPLAVYLALLDGRGD